MTNWCLFDYTEGRGLKHTLQTILPLFRSLFWRWLGSGFIGWLRSGCQCWRGRCPCGCLCRVDCRGRGRRKSWTRRGCPCGRTCWVGSRCNSRIGRGCLCGCNSRVGSRCNSRIGRGCMCGRNSWVGGRRNRWTGRRRLCGCNSWIGRGCLCGHSRRCGSGTTEDLADGGVCAIAATVGGATTTRVAIRRGKVAELAHATTVDTELQTRITEATGAAIGVDCAVCALVTAMLCTPGHTPQ